MSTTIRVSRARRVRHRKFKGITRGGGRPRLERLDSWLAERETTLDGTGTAATVAVVDDVNDELDIVAHPFVDFDVVRVSSTLTIPPGLDAAIDYVVEDVAVGSIALARTARMRQEGKREDITGAGTGVISVTPRALKSSLLLWLHSRLPVQIQNATDVDNL